MTDIAPDSITPIRGLRIWSLKNGKLYPFSYTDEFEWRPGENVAVCSRSGERYGFWRTSGISGYHYGSIHHDPQPDDFKKTELFYPALHGFGWERRTILDQERYLRRVEFEQTQELRRRAQEEAERRRYQHTPPGGETCGCGFWAVSEERHLPYSANYNNAKGVIEMYGKVDVGTKGFRSEKARVVGFIKPKDRSHRDVIHSLAKKFGVPVFKSVEKAAITRIEVV